MSELPEGYDGWKTYTPDQYEEGVYEDIEYEYRIDESLYKRVLYFLTGSNDNRAKELANQLSKRAKKFEIDY